MTQNIKNIYFTGQNIVVKYDLPTHVRLPFIIQGREITEEIWKTLAGAMDNSTVTIRHHEEGEYSGISVYVTHPILDEPSIRIIYRPEGNETRLLLRNHNLILNQNYQQQGIGLYSFAQGAITAAELGFPAITARAAGFPHTKNKLGWWAWPRMGFDAKLQISQLFKRPNSLRACTTVLDLFATAEGREFWKTVARPMEMQFDLAEHSRSWAVLLAYMNEKGCLL